MPETVWLNGRFLSREQAQVSAFDAGFQHGVGLFETMLAAGPDGRVFHLHRHLERLERSARALGLTDSLKPRALAELIETVVARAELSDDSRRARVRLTITGGDLNLLSSTGRGPVDPTILIVVQPATAYPEEMFTRGVRALVADIKANPLDPFAGHKTLNYWWRLHELQRAASARAAEAIVLQVTNHVCGGAVSNLFIVKDGSLLTPIARGEEEPGGLPSPALPGITRSAILDAADLMRIGCARRMLTINDVMEADELFLTNSSWGVLPVTHVEAHTVGAGTPGPVTLSLREKWLELVRTEP